MNRVDSCCDDDRAEDYLCERLSVEQQAEFETHLVECEYCRGRLDALAANAGMWQEAEELLGGHSHIVFEPDHELSTSGLAESSLSNSNSSNQVRLGQAMSVLDSLAPTDDPEMLGRIGDYEVNGVVGVGGMGAVLKGFDKSLRRVVAIKVMAPHLAGSGSARIRFQREARAAAAITHDNIIDIYGVSEANGLPYLVMPYARGPSLQRRIDDGGPLSVAEVLRIGRQIASGLAAAHEQGLVHRDIKPANILLNEGVERLWVTDFGVARAMDDASMTQTGVIAGTPQYMSPEQARGEPVDHRSDLFSLGSILYTACTGRPPFRSEAAYGILRRITDSDPRPIPEINPDVPDWMSRIIGKLMAKHPSDRFGSAAEVAELFDNCLAHLQQPTQVALPGSLISPPSQATGERRYSRFGITLPSGVSIMVAVVGIIALAVGVLQVTAPPDISGVWGGDNWETVSLTSVDQAPGWYSGKFANSAGDAGTLQLRWSRLQRRYNGEWRLGDRRRNASPEWGRKDWWSYFCRPQCQSHGNYAATA